MMVDHELNELRREFLVEARGKVNEMRSALEAGRSPESLERLVYLAHQLKGSGGSYGYPAISDNAAEVEKALEESDSGAPLPEQIQQHMLRLSSEIEKCQRELG